MLHEILTFLWNIFGPITFLYEFERWLDAIVPPCVAAFKLVVSSLASYLPDFLAIYLDDFYELLNWTIYIISFLASVYGFVGGIFYILFHQSAARLERIGERYPPFTNERILIVIAHPDDECMFFGPTIVEFQRMYHIYVLCLTDGNYYGLGSARKAELWASCRALGLPDENITLMKNTNMPDNPNVKWDPNRTYEIIMDHVERNSITQVYTFDYNGVSGHANHRSIYFAFANMSIRNVIPRYLQVYLLESVNIFRKYMMFFDSCLSYLTCKHILMVTIDEFRIIQDAMFSVNCCV
ncbi:N-acetylglucosaminyl-phosphatidylinositol de-N-acetylase-like isoform X2 [Homalodisca vitripennis]|uniref:N-acetylglucosaminyl-phosphatidylinositol de-N-acetylase-like isoform X2 n=1 Tax=Homalodisca vitripennis TaxID=197043 RepID=UPI001EEA7ABB|nr:N-acetylglucosaminyl-phosphatidylinositol de-N-acetylase-like isoform X2 [Homalodisca vitripennis]